MLTSPLEDGPERLLAWSGVQEKLASDLVRRRAAGRRQRDRAKAHRAGVSDR
jgi:hypothetical protein